MKFTKKLLTLLITCALLGVQTASVLAADGPKDVTGLTAAAVDSTSIGLTWSPAKDGSGNAVDHYRVYYGTTSVFKAKEGDYDGQVDTKDNKASYTVNKLTPDTTYYFSVTAIDSKKNESAQYSLETSAKTFATKSSTKEDDKSTIDKTAPTVASVAAPDKTHVKVVFSEKVVLPTESPETAFSIKEQVTSSKTLTVKSAKLDITDVANKTVLLETADQTASTNYIVTVGVTVKDVSGNPMVSGSTDSGLFLGSSKTAVKPTPIPKETKKESTIVKKDVTPPENVTKLLLSYKKQLKKFVVMLSWTASVNTAKDLADQLLYISMDRGKVYDKGKSLGASVTKAQVSNLTGGKEYTFKLTTKDKTGNESTGVVKAIRLPQTGFGIGLLLIGSMYGASRVMRRKK